MDDISPYRALTPELLRSEATFLPMPKVVQWMETNGGWAEGDATFTGPSRPTDAEILYYQKSRHIFGDLKIEVFDAQGKLAGTVPSSKHRGVNRAAWSMHLKPPKVPPAASAAFSAAFGPRVLPGIYTVKMTKGDHVYTTKLNVVMDPRAKYTVEDRRAQFALVMRLSGLLNHMSWAVDAILGVRDAASNRTTGLAETDPLRQQLLKLAGEVDQIRSEIVATKEGGAVTGEERLREYLAGVYGDVNGYEGRPTDSQVARTGALEHEISDVIHKFQEVTGRELPALNDALQTKNLTPIRVISEEEWRKAHADELQ